jgi:hypothetical protein
MLAIVPSTNIGVGMVILAVLCLFNTWNLHAKNRFANAQIRVLIVTTINYLAEFAGGVILIAHQHEVWIVNGLCYVIFASFIIALNRAWALIRSEMTVPASS